MNIQKIDINKLKPAEYNPRKDLQAEDREYEKIKRSILEFGYVDPIIINKDYTVIRRPSKTKSIKRIRLYKSRVRCGRFR